MALETEYSFAPYTLPSATDNPYRTPSLGLSRRSSRQGSSSPAMSSSPPPIPPRGDLYFVENNDKDVSKDESISILDPRRFTPTLHASLVSEILSLRREVESKNSLVLSLEESLDASKVENEKLNETVASHEKETRSLKSRMGQLEGESLSTLEEIVKERDEAVESLQDTRKRLEVSQKKTRNQEEEAYRTYSLWDGDRQRWDAEKRNLDRKVHITETRLKTILNEMEVARSNDLHQVSADSQLEDLHREDWSNINGTLQKTPGGQRPESAMSSRSVDGGEPRNARFSSSFGVRGSMFNGPSLAEELEFDEDEDADVEEGDLGTGQMSPGALPEEAEPLSRPFSSQSQRGSSKARKLLGLPVEEENLSSGETPAKRHIDSEKSEEQLEEHGRAAREYTSAATQYSPPSSPTISALRLPEATHSITAGSLPDPGLIERQELNDSQPSSQLSAPSIRTTFTVSQACQTIEQPLSPPESPVINETGGFGKGYYSKPVEMKIASTQTDELPVLRPSDQANQDAFQMPVDVPTIAIHPPITSPGIDRPTKVVLPPRTRSAGCQVSIRPTSLRSVSVQTEEIRIDNRPVKLPPHLLPSSISSNPPSPAPGARAASNHRLETQPRRRTPPKLREPPPIQSGKPNTVLSSDTVRDGYPGNNDNGPLNNLRDSELRRPIRSESLFAGFDAENDEEQGPVDDAEFSDDSFVNKEPIRKTLSKVKNSWKLIPQTNDALDARLESTKEDHTIATTPEEAKDHRAYQKDLADQSHIDPRFWREKTAEKPQIPITLAKQPNIRRAALISNGAAAHAQRPRSPDVGATQGKDPSPPFPVPTRASSRKIPFSASDGAQSPTPQSTSFFSGQLRKDQGRAPSKKPVLRKIRSAAAATNPSHNEALLKRTRSPPPPASSSSIPESPHLPQPPPLPVDDITIPSEQTFHPAGHHHQSSTLSEAANEQISVVDAIAQTMIGEWMWKYVRRRKSFGMTESPAAEFEGGRNGSENGSVNGIRHKRWVWLAPYERAVLWSSKQPTSGSALMGKSGRKLTIQSVLDVKDDTPMPKNSDNYPTVGRSILILTPERALKFTAMTKERHYVWLAALSFLSHSSLGVDDLTSLPPVPPKEYQLPARDQSTAALRRGPIRDSIRIAKDKARPEVSGRRAFTSPTNGIPSGVINEYTSKFAVQGERGAAEAPHVPRFSTHSRQRSNTGPRPMPPSSFRSFASTVKPSSHSATIASSDTYTRSSSGMDRSGIGSSYSSGNVRRGRDDVSSPSIDTNNFFDAVGTVRMEAFVDRTRGYMDERSHKSSFWDRNAEDRSHQATREKEKKSSRTYRSRQGKQKDVGYWGAGGAASGSEAATRRDPFEDF